MSKVKPVITLICGAVALAGVFLPWMDPGSGLMVSGWELPRYSIDIGVPQPYFVLVGSIIMIFLGALAVISEVGIMKLGTFRSHAVACSIASFAVLVACLWYIIFLLAFRELESMRYGVIVSLVPAVIGLVPAGASFIHISLSRGAGRVEED
jgi:hypothetical protein